MPPKGGILFTEVSSFNLEALLKKNESAPIEVDIDGLLDAGQSLSLATALFPDDAHASATLMSTVLFVSLAFQCYFWPWRTVMLNCVDAGVVIVLLLILTASRGLAQQVEKPQPYVTLMTATLAIAVGLVFCVAGLGFQSVCRHGRKAAVPTKMIHGKKMHEFAATIVEATERLAMHTGNPDKVEELLTKMSYFDILQLHEGIDVIFYTFADIGQREAGRRTSLSKRVMTRGSYYKSSNAGSASRVRQGSHHQNNSTNDSGSLVKLSRLVEGPGTGKRAQRTGMQGSLSRETAVQALLTSGQTTGARPMDRNSRNTTSAAAAHPDARSSLLANDKLRPECKHSFTQTDSGLSLLPKAAAARMDLSDSQSVDTAALELVEI